MKKIRIACDVKDFLDIDELIPFQGKLKTLSKLNYEKLKKEILTTGFAFPLYIWKDKKKNYILAGHQRKSCLLSMREEGYAIPKLPVVYIEAGSIKEAKRRIIQDIGQYGKIDRIGMSEFITDSEISIEDIRDSFVIPDGEMNFSYLSGVEVKDAKGEWASMPEFTQNDKTSFRHLIVHFTCDEDAKKFFSLIGYADTGKTRSIWFPEQENMDTESKRYDSK